MALLLPTAGPTTALPFPSLLPPAKLTVSFRKPRSSALPTVNPQSSLSSSISPPPAVETAPPPTLLTPTGWVIVMESPPVAAPSRSETINYYVETLAKVLGSEKAAQASIYNASWQTYFGFCCDIDEESSKQLSSIPGVLLVRPDKEPESEKKDYTCSDFSVGGRTNADPSLVNSEYWIVRMEKPGVEVVTKAQMVDHYARTLTKVMGNEKDAQVSIYNISWEKDFGFCCQIDEECARELVDVPGVLSVRPDNNFESGNKDYKGNGISDSLEQTEPPEVKAKRLFVTGLSFYTSEKTLRAAFEGFGELVEVKIIMDKISKRSKGYAFIEYTTEEAGSAALKEMNGKIINGWMIVVDVAKTNPPRISRGRPRPLGLSPSSY